MPPSRSVPDVQEKRRSWNVTMSGINAEHLVFLDESGINTNLTRLYAHALHWKRAVDAAPLNTPTATTVLSSIRLDSTTIFTIYQGGTTAARFREYIENQLVPSLKKEVKAVYQRYMGWYDPNPVHLDELEPTEYASKLVEYLGDADAVLKMAQADYEKGEYQWVAQITNTLVYADPQNQGARYLCADALEQLGYQAESGAWRNAYLTAAFELRNGTDLYPQTSAIGVGSTAQNMDAETMLN